MLMNELEGTKIKIRSRLYQQLLFAFLNKKERDNFYKSTYSEPKDYDKWYNSVKQEYDNLTLQQLLDELYIQHPEEIKQFRCCGDKTVAELNKLLEGAE